MITMNTSTHICEVFLASHLLKVPHRCSMPELPSYFPYLILLCLENLLVPKSLAHTQVFKHDISLKQLFGNIPGHAVISGRLAWLPFFWDPAASYTFFLI